ASRCGCSAAKCSTRPAPRRRKRRRKSRPRRRGRSRRPETRHGYWANDMLQPKRTKFRKQFKGRNRGLAHRGSSVSFGEYGLKSRDRGQLTARQIEAARRAMTRYVKRGGNIWIRVFPDKPITKKPLEVRQGKGKGNVEYWVAQIQPGRMLY